MKKKIITVVILALLLQIYTGAQLQTQALIQDDGPANDPPPEIAAMAAITGGDTLDLPFSNILLLDDGGSPGLEGKGAFDYLGWGYTWVADKTGADYTLAEFATGVVNLYDYKVIFVAWWPTQAELAALNARAGDLATWISSGRGIVVNGEWGLDAYSFLPGSPWGATLLHSNGLTMVDPSHPLVSGLTVGDLDNWWNSIHGVVTAPTGITVVTQVTATGTPHIFTMCFGAGKIVVAASDPEWHVAVQYKSAAALLLYNEITYAATPAPCGPPPGAPLFSDAFLILPSTVLAGALVVLRRRRKQTTK